MSALFIVGAPRSGTTLIQHIIASHSTYFSLPDTFFFANICSLGVEYYNPEKTVTSSDIKIIEHNFNCMTGFTIDLQKSILNKKTIKDVFEYITQLFNADNKINWLEKTPTHALHMMAIHRFYPDAKFIHIMRDPVDSVGSMMNLRPTSINDFRLNYLKSWSNRCELWKKCVTSALNYPYQDHVLHIFYEELVMDPENQTRKICEFLNIHFENSMLESFSETAKKNISADHCPWQKDNLIPGFNANAVFKWRKRLSPYHIWLIQSQVKDLAMTLGYYSEMGTVSRFMKLIYTLKDKLLMIIVKSRIETQIRKTIGAICR